MHLCSEKINSSGISANLNENYRRYNFPALANIPIISGNLNSQP